eukprot:CAMPEP_0183786822 /NCGR_PEP_ID=MMETSP0739-20130205/67225_1 /TAXON_ID=385413 /ORGANISM="Thalassiosira miniscula, Strain CCMP1093" /LENGTH=44 /DNA_ID= /DNA_START= /DNA_END= /DNA_ORIENTATION=
MKSLLAAPSGSCELKPLSATEACESSLLALLAMASSSFATFWNL